MITKCVASDFNDWGQAFRNNITIVSRLLTFITNKF
jgi:hypothetical protein